MISHLHTTNLLLGLLLRMTDNIDGSSLVQYSAISFKITDLHSLHRDLVPYVSWIKTLDLPPSNPKSIFGGIRGSSTSNAGKAGMIPLTTVR